MHGVQNDIESVHIGILALFGLGLRKNFQKRSQEVGPPHTAAQEPVINLEPLTPYCTLKPEFRGNEQLATVSA
jgi:hypothetical protein